MEQFNQFPLHPQIQGALAALGFTEPTPIQAQTLPILLKDPKTHLHGQAQTGTGKTLAFGLPLVHHIDPTSKKVQALVVAPTRELAVQIYQSLLTIAQARGISIAAVYGGVSIERQFRDLRSMPQIVVGTPGRLNDHINRRTLKLDDCQIVVLDEADIMLDMGFKDEVEELISATPKTRALWLFSATVKDGISDLIKSHMPNPASVRVSSTNVASTNTAQFYAVVPRRSRFEALCRIIETTEDLYGFVFCQTKALTAELADMLIKRGYRAQALHGDMGQNLRNQVIKGFKEKRFQLLVATDVAARGLDVPDVTHVINYGLPEDQEIYIHRIGRTGRAGKLGIAITLIDSNQEWRLKSLVRRYKMNVTPYEIPTASSIMEKRVVKIINELKQMANIESRNSYEMAVAQQLATLNHDELVKALVGAAQKIYGSFATEQEQIHAAPSSDDREESKQRRGGGRRFFGARRFGGRSRY